jgi:CheY-like chemotaxis protein
MGMPSGHILVADDDAGIRTVLNQALTRAGYEVRATGTVAGLWRWVAAGEGDLVITDVVMPDDNAFDLLPRIKRMRPDLPIIVMSAQNTFITAIKASERGAYEYLPKPFDLRELVAIVGRALAEPKRRREEPEAGPVEVMPIVGRSPAMQDIFRILARLMQTDLTVMISGESGTGKELVAKALHDYGKRKGGPFVAINMAAIPRDLIATRRAPSPAPLPAPLVVSNRRKAEPCFSMKSATCRWRPKPVFYAFCSRANIRRLAAAPRSRRTSGLSPRQIRTCASRSSKARFGRICSSASTSCRSVFPPCASARRTSLTLCARSFNAMRRRGCRSRHSSLPRWSAFAVIPGPETCVSLKISLVAFPRSIPRM